MRPPFFYKKSVILHGHKGRFSLRAHFGGLMPRFTIAIFTIFFALASGCAKNNSIFDDVGANIATSNAMFVDVASNRLYVVNSNAKVLYDWHEGSFQVYDISNPLAPTLIKSTDTLSFSGQIYLDLINKKAYVPNRFSENSTIETDTLFVFDINEASSNFLSYNSYSVGQNAYAIDCCYPANRAWITTSAGKLQYVDINTSSLQTNDVNLITPLDNGGTLSHAEANYIVILNNMAFLSREYGGLFVVNLDDAGVSGAVAVDYFISDVQNPRGLATDGTYIYVVGEGDEDGDWHRFLLILDPATLTPVSGNSTTAVLGKTINNLQIALIDVGNYPQEVLLSTSYAFVTNQDDDTVSVIDLATRTKIKDITVGDQPFSMALYRTLGGVDQYLYVSNVESNTISIIDIPSLSVVATYP